MPRSAIAGPYGLYMFSFVRNPQTALQSGSTRLHSHQVTNEIPFGSTSLSALGIVCVPDFGHSQWYLVLFWLSLPTYDAEHVFISSFAICIYSWVRWLWRSDYFFSWSAVVDVYSFRNTPMRKYQLWLGSYLYYYYFLVSFVFDHYQYIIDI